MKMKLLVITLCLFQFQIAFCWLYDYASLRSETIKPTDFLEVSREQVEFRLWTRDQTDAYIRIYPGNLTTVASIRQKNVFKIIVHGYLHSADEQWMLDMKTTYLSVADYNVILIDWSTLSHEVYPISVAGTKDVGKYIGDLILDLHNTLEVPHAKIHIIGHSLGAHVAGFAGKWIKSQTNTTIDRITGLDPAGPLFVFTDKANRLANTDATFVDAIHTDGLKYGYIYSIGTIDFYPNSGYSPQPGCHIDDTAEDIIGCSHIRAIYIFTESITSSKFISNSCSSGLSYALGFCKYSQKAAMGENVNKTLTGNFYLSTNAIVPYARNGVI